MAASMSARGFEPQSTDARDLAREIQALRVELIELAFAFDRQGRADAADLAVNVAHRIGVLLITHSGRVGDRGAILPPTVHSPLAR